MKKAGSLPKELAGPDNCPRLTLWTCGVESVYSTHLIETCHTIRRVRLLCSTDFVPFEQASKIEPFDWFSLRKPGLWSIRFGPDLGPLIPRAEFYQASDTHLPLGLVGNFLPVDPITEPDSAAVYPHGRDIYFVHGILVCVGWGRRNSCLDQRLNGITPKGQHEPLYYSTFSTNLSS